MATGGADDDTDLYTCQVCLEDQTKRTPRLLSCHHSFCQDCIKKLVKEGKVECPTCRKLTLIAEDDVAELSMNFMLMKMKEHVDKLLHNKQSFCQVCGVTAAHKKCRECSHLLCDPCILKHESYEGFKEHQILPVCPKHQQGLLNHLCVKCIKSVCSVCIMNDHATHKEDILTYSEGMLKIRKNLDELQSDLKKKHLPFTEKKTKNKEQMLQNQKLEKDMLGIYDEYIEKSQKVFKCIEEIRSYNKKTFNFFEENEEAERLIVKMLDCMSENDVNLLKLYPDIKDKAERLLAREEDGFTYEIFSIDKSYLQSINLLQNNKYESQALRLSEVKRKKPPFDVEVVYETSDISKLNLDNPQRIQCIHSQNAAVFDVSTWNFVEIELNLEFGRSENRKFTFNIDTNDCIYSGGCLVMACRNMLTQCIWPTWVKKMEYNTNLEQTSKIFQGIAMKFVIYDNILQRVYEYCNQKMKKVLSDITVNHICVHLVKGVPIGYVITETMYSTLGLYDKDWCLQKFITIPEIKGPSECISTPMGLLVANTGKNCITLLDNQGELVEECVVGEKEGIRRPVSIDYMEPYLWIAEYDKYQGHRSIKCFELRPNH